MQVSVEPSLVCGLPVVDEILESEDVSSSEGNELMTVLRQEQAVASEPKRFPNTGLMLCVLDAIRTIFVNADFYHLLLAV